MKNKEYQIKEEVIEEISHNITDNEIILKNEIIKIEQKLHTQLIIKDEVIEQTGSASYYQESSKAWSNSRKCSCLYYSTYLEFSS